MNSRFFLILVFLYTGSLQGAEVNCPSKINGIEINQVGQLLGNGEMIAHIHAAVARGGFYSVTYRDPSSFFKFLDFSLLAQNEEVKSVLRTLNRHDKVQITGKLKDIEPCFPHVEVSEIKVLERFTGLDPFKDYVYKGRYQDILDGNTLIGKIHFVSPEQNLLVIEYQDLVVPVFIEKDFSEELKKFFRNDVVKIQYFARLSPRSPPHIELDLLTTKPIQRLIPIDRGHGEEIELKGRLVMFPKSPQIKFPIFAVAKEGQWGTPINFTLVNFENSKFFSKLLKKLNRKWKRHRRYIERGRNYLINTRLEVTVKGTKNVVSRQQANPQILVNRWRDLDFKLLKKNK
jgi:hypothetical protein